jgi:hypothetical protein
MDQFDIAYERCNKCGFLQTEEPFWLEQAYQQPLSAADTGLVSRPISLAPVIEAIIRRGFDLRGRYLDYGGGTGLFVRLMRDRGFDFFRQDRYVEPIFCRYFDLEDLPDQDRRFEIVTAFELIEHLPRPAIEISEMLKLTDSIICSTELIPNGSVNDIESWWYLGIDHGQHISFFTRDSLSALASNIGCRYIQLDANLHLITRLGDIKTRLERELDLCHLDSLAWRDMEYALDRRRTTKS